MLGRDTTYDEPNPASFSLCCEGHFGANEIALMTYVAVVYFE
jgi:hypothetical protein